MISSVSAPQTAFKITSHRAKFTHHTTRRIAHFDNGSSRCHHRPHAVGDDAVQSWLDLASFVATTGSSRTPYDELADKIGRECYIDVAGWHLYLKDVKIGGQASLAQGLATKLGPLIQDKFDDHIVEDLLKKVPIKLGQGKTTVSLAQVLPTMCVSMIVEICEDYARDL